MIEMVMIMVHRVPILINDQRSTTTYLHHTPSLPVSQTITTPPSHISCMLLLTSSQNSSIFKRVSCINDSRSARKYKVEDTCLVSLIEPTVTTLLSQDVILEHSVCSSLQYLQPTVFPYLQLLSSYDTTNV